MSRVLACCCLVAAVACGPNQVGSRYVKSETVKANQGAVIEVSKSDSTVLAGTKLEVPAGALSADTPITLELGMKNLVDSNAASPVAVWGPSGLHFASPATMTLPLNLAQGAATDHLNIQVQEENGTTFRIPRSDLLIAGNTVTFKVDGFTSFQANTQNACMADTDCSTGERCVNGGCQGGMGGGAGGGNGGGMGGGNGGGQGGGTNACQVDTDCPMGEACRNGACTTGTGGGAGGGMSGGQGGGTNACQTNADCAMGEYCVNGACTTNGTGGGMGGGQGGGMGGGQGGGNVDGGLSCMTDTDCAMGESCVNGTCTVVNYCRQDSDCPMGELCDANSGTCYVSQDGGANDGGMNPDAGVNDGGTNDGGMNPDAGVNDGGQNGDGGIDAGQSQNCQVDTDCPMPELCVQSFCQAIPCDMNRACPGSYQCVNNWCQ